MLFTFDVGEHKDIDKELLERIARKDQNALSQLYDRHSTMMYSMIIRIVKEKEEAEDILQDVFIKVWERSELYDARIGSPGSWLARIAHNKAIDRLRSKGHRQRSQETDIGSYQDYFMADHSQSPERHVILSSQQEDILIALTSLSKEYKELIEYAYFRGYTQSELAEHFGVPLGTVKTRIRTALSILRQKLRHHLA